MNTIKRNPHEHEGSVEVNEIIESIDKNINKKDVVSEINELYNQITQKPSGELQQETKTMNTTPTINNTPITLWCDQFNTNTYNIKANPHDNTTIVFTTVFTIPETIQSIIDLYAQTIHSMWKRTYKNNVNAKLFDEKINVSTVNLETTVIQIQLTSDFEQLLPPEITAGVLNSITTTIIGDTKKAITHIDTRKQQFVEKLRELQALNITSTKEIEETFGTTMSYKKTGVYKEIDDLLQKLGQAIKKL